MTHSVKIIVRILPRQVTLLVIYESTRSDIDPGYAEVVEQNEDLAENTESILNIVFLTLAFVWFDNVHDLSDQVVELANLVDADYFEWSKNDVHSAEYIRYSSYQIKDEIRRQIFHKYVIIVTCHASWLLSDAIDNDIHDKAHLNKPEWDTGRWEEFWPEHDCGSGD